MSSLDPDLCCNCRRNLEESCTDFAPTQNFCVVQLPRFFFISSMRHVASSFSPFFVRETSSFRQAFPVFLLVQALRSGQHPFLHFLCHIWSTRFFFSFKSVLSTSIKSAKTSINFPVGFARSQMSTKLCPPLFPRVAATWFSWCHTTLCFSTYHFSLSWPFSELQLSFSHWTVFIFGCASMKRNGHLVHGS